MMPTNWWHLPAIALAGTVIVAVAAVFLPDPRQEQEVVIASVQLPPVEEYCYTPYGTDVEPEYILNGVYVMVKWLKDAEPGAGGYAVWEMQKNGLMICGIKVRLPDKILGDPDMDTLGHELLHCLTGDFHPEDE